MQQLSQIFYRIFPENCFSCILPSSKSKDMFSHYITITSNWCQLKKSVWIADAVTVTSLRIFHMNFCSNIWYFFTNISASILQQ